MSKFLRVAASAIRPTIAQQFPMRSIMSPMNRIVIRSFADDKDDEPFLDAKEVADRIVEVVMNFDKIKKENVTAVARFKEDLDLDSLDAVEIVMLIEEEFHIEIPDSEADKILSVADAVAFVSSHPMAK